LQPGPAIYEAEEKTEQRGEKGAALFVLDVRRQELSRTKGLAHERVGLPWVVKVMGKGEERQGRSESRRLPGNWEGGKKKNAIKMEGKKS